MTVRVRRLLPALALLVAACTAASAGAPSLAIEVRAAFLKTFPDFVTWPAAALAADAPLQLCVLDEDPVGDSLERMTGGKTIAGHPVRVRRVRAAEDVAGCHVVYVGTGSSRLARTVIGALHDRPVLTVAEDNHMPAVDTMIEFHLEDQKLRFDVELAPAGRAGLKFDSKLLGIAREVRR